MALSGFNPVPWAVEGGALNQVVTARILAYAATQHASGVVGVGDLKVRQMSTPGAGFEVAAGACVIRSLYLSGTAYPNESYIADRPYDSLDHFPLSANGGASVRRDMIIARVNNPWVDPNAGASPADPTFGPYVGVDRIVNVPDYAIASVADANQYLIDRDISAIPLAAVTMPAGASSVLNAYIKDLRNVAQPNRWRPGVQTYNLTGSEKRTVTSSSYADWFKLPSWMVRVPEWATYATVVATVVGVRLDRQSSSTNGRVNGSVRVGIGTNAADSTFTQGITYDFDALSNSQATRNIVMCADTVRLAGDYGNSNVYLYIQAKEDGGNQHLYADSGSAAFIDVEFLEQAV